MGELTETGFVADGMPPYLPSTRWMQTRGHSMAMKTRDYTRSRIWSNTPGGMMLTVPVGGGSSAVKRLKPAALRISDHGDWTRIHLGALDAAYGKEPYFQYLFPGIASLIGDYPEMLSDLNEALVAEMIKFLDYANLMPGILELRRRNPDRCLSLARRIEEKIDPEHSFLEPLFRFGRDALFLLD